MLLKFTGCLLIITAASGYGYLKGLEYKKQINQMRYLEQLIREIGGEIAYSKVPLPEVFCRTAKGKREPYGRWLRRMAEIMQEKEAAHFGKLWRSNTEEMLGKLELDKEECEKLIELGERMNYLDIRMQEQTLLCYAEGLEERSSRKEGSLYEKQRLCSLLGAAGGIFLAIILL